MYPGELDGNEHIEIDVNGKKQMLNLISNITYYDIETTPNSVAQIYMKSDFYLKDAQEQRGETRMSFILNIKTE